MTLYLKYLKYKNKYFELTRLLQNIPIKENSEIFNKLTGEYNSYVINDTDKETIKNEIYKLCKNSTNKWVSCVNDCFEKLNKIIEKEINSSKYMYTIIRESVCKGNIGITFKRKINSQINDIKDNDKWDDHDITLTNTDNKTRLIMGLGPSASGKTYWANLIMEKLSSIKDFPKNFIAIDGGIYREKCMTYKYIIETIKQTKTLADGAPKKGIDGIENLASSKIFRKSLFNSSKIKKRMIDLLSIQQCKFSLYVPTTLSKCILGCSFDKYYKISDDKGNWICAFIWQHKDIKNCDYINKCVGCTNSGKSREKEEGKKYSNSMWKVSYSRGLSNMIKAPGGYINIHNCGKKDCKSTIIIKSGINNELDEMCSFFKDNKCVQKKN